MLNLFMIIDYLKIQLQKVLIDMKRYIVQCKVLLSYTDYKEYKLKDYAIKYCKRMNEQFENLEFRVIEVVYEEI